MAAGFRVDLQVHHDLKAKNFVRFFDGRYCLVDFDNCRTGEKQDMGLTTLEICPPEVTSLWQA